MAAKGGVFVCHCHQTLSIDSLVDTFVGRRHTLLRMCPDCRAVAAMLEVERGWEP